MSFYPKVPNFQLVASAKMRELFKQWFISAHVARVGVTLLELFVRHITFLP